MLTLPATGDPGKIGDVTPTSNLVPATAPWWVGDAWNEDTLDWFISLEEINVDVSIMSLEAVFEEYHPALPCVAPSAEWLVKLYLAIGEPPVEETDSRYLSTRQPNVATKFQHDPEDPVLSLPMQLVKYYLHYNGPQQKFHMLTQHRLAARLMQLLSVINFTPAEWEWLLDELGPESFDLYGGLFKYVSNNPSILALPATENLSGHRPADFINIQVRNGLQFLLRETQKLEVGEAPSPSRTSGFNELLVWAHGVNASAAMLSEAVAMLGEATEISTRAHREIVANEGKPLSHRTTESVFCTNAVRLLEAIDAHPNYEEDLADELILQLTENLDLGDFKFTADLQALEAVTQEITNPNHKHFTELEEIHRSTGLVPYGDEDEGLTAEQSLHLLYALVHFTRDEARTVFQNLVLTPGVSDQHLFATAQMMPMLSGFFTELRETFGDQERNIPLLWLLEANAVPGRGDL